MDKPGQKVLTEEHWDEAQIEQALKRLKELHIQLRKLRSTIPRMMEPIFIPHESAEAMFTTVCESINFAYDDIRDYKQAMTNDENTKIIQHAKQSRQDSPMGIKPWRAVDEPDWFTPDI